MKVAESCRKQSEQDQRYDDDQFPIKSYNLKRSRIDCNGIKPHKLVIHLEYGRPLDSPNTAIHELAFEEQN